MTDSLASALLSPGCYPHETGQIRLLETHISRVLLTGPFAYKIKKPVNFGFLDFSTLDRRRHFCEEEVRLNARFSQGLYLGVVPITLDAGQPRLGGEGEAVEYAVKMRQFDPDALLSRLIEDPGLETETVKALARQLARFHEAGAARPGQGREGEREWRYATAAAPSRAALDNFDQIRSQLEDADERRTLAVLEDWTRERLRVLRDVFERRGREGYVRECHGDLHLGNIARIDGELTFFDCIEFSPALRWVDIQSELAFLLMDLEEKRLWEEASLLLNTWLEYTGDYAGLEVLDFYKVYRAMVRAKVERLRLAEGDLSADEERRCRNEYANYIRLAQSYCRPPRPYLALTHGVSGTGKSTAAAVLAAHTRALRIRSDVERKRLFGLTPDASSPAERRADMYSEAASDRTFDRLAALARQLLALGLPVIVDATFIAEPRRRPFLALARELAVPFVILEARASEATIVRRLEQRQARGGSTSEAGVEVMRRQLAHVDPFTPDEAPYVLPVDTEQPIRAEPLLAFVGAGGQAEGGT